MSHAVVCMAQKLRDIGGAGLLYGNGGIVTTNHAIVLSSRPFPKAAFPKSFDVQAEADAAREPVPPLEEDYVGPAVIETYTVHYARDSSVRSGIVLCRTPDGARTVARVPATDAAGIAFLSDGRDEPIGVSGAIVATGDGDRIFRRA
jgi:acetyl-CoA C-acetyltransferase